MDSGKARSNGPKVKEKYLQKYCDLMEEVKHRVAVIDFLQSPPFVAVVPKFARVESIAMQFRKILELIAMGSLVTNRDALAAAAKSFDRQWRAAAIMEGISKLNPAFYPVPQLTNPTEFSDATDDVLTQDGWSSLYDACSKLLHTKNPFDTRETRNEGFVNEIGLWRDRIVRLLSVHKIRLAGTLDLVLIWMETKDSPRVHYGYMSYVGPAKPDAKSGA